MLGLLICLIYEWASLKFVCLFFFCRWMPTSLYEILIKTLQDVKVPLKVNAILTFHCDASAEIILIKYRDVGVHPEFV